MEKKKLQSVSIAALIVSILPLAALAHRFCTFRCRMESEPLGPGPISFLSCWA